MPSEGDVVAGKYEIRGLIGQGGMGAVFEAVHRVTGKRVALKWLLPSFSQLPEAVDRFVREAQAAARVEHPNVVDVYDIGAEGDCHFLVMEFLDGESLGDVIEKKPLEPAEVIRLLLPALDAVAVAHESGIVHRDIKPDNLFLCMDPGGAVREVKILDFGISKLTGAVAAGPLTVTGTTMGTPHYMSPEQLRGDKDIDGRADVYAFGVILYEAITGRKPFEADNFGALAMEVVTRTPPRPSEVVGTLDPALDEAVVRAIATDREQRHATARHFLAAIEPFAGHAEVRVKRDTRPRQRTQVLPTPISSAPRDGGSGRRTPQAVTPVRTPPPTQGPTSQATSSPRGAGVWVAAGALGVLALGLAGWFAFGVQSVPAPPQVQLAAPRQSQAEPARPASAVEPAGTIHPNEATKPSAPAPRESPQGGWVAQEAMVLNPEVDSPAAKAPAARAKDRKRSSTGTKARGQGGKERRRSARRPAARRGPAEAESDLSLDDF